MLEYLVFFGSALVLLGTIAYIRDSLRGITKPNRVTWILWGTFPLIGSAAAFSSGVGWAMLPVLMSGIGPFMVLASSFVNPNAYWKLGTLDYVCGALSILAIVFWVTTQQPAIAIIFALIGEAFAAAPTLLKAWRYPETETGFAYITSFLAMLTSFPLVERWDFTEYGYPLYLAFINGLFIIAIYRKRPSGLSGTIHAGAT